MFAPWAAEHSVLREKVIEHAFLAETSRSHQLDLAMPSETLGGSSEDHKMAARLGFAN